jgi:hypothetical protein
MPAEFDQLRYPCRAGLVGAEQGSAEVRLRIEHHLKGLAKRHGSSRGVVLSREIVVPNELRRGDERLLWLVLDVVISFGRLTVLQFV